MTAETFDATRRYEVRYRLAPAWEVGERTPDHRPGEHYQDDYAGKVLDVRPVDSDLPSLRNMADKTRPVIELDLTAEALNGLRSRTMKIEGTHSLARPAPVTFDDRWGAVAATLRANFDDAEKAESDGGDRDSFEGRRFTELALIAKRGLPAPDVHTGTGQYFTKATPTKRDDTQSGAAAGQIITLTTAGLGTSDAFIGGYILNVTESETRAIVSHTDNTVTLEGDLSAWSDGDDLDIYNAWSTIQGALDQLWTDQSTAGFGATQYIRIFAGTYVENVVPNTSLNPQEGTGKILVIEGNPTDARTNIIIAPSGGSYALDLNCDCCLVRHLNLAGTPTSRTVIFQTGCEQGELNDCVVTSIDWYAPIGASNTRGLRVINCDITMGAGGTTGIHNLQAGAMILGCILTGSGGAAVALGHGCTILGCTFSGWDYPVAFANSLHHHTRLINNTIYNCANGIHIAGFQGYYTLINNIFKDCTTIVRQNAKPDEASGTLGGHVTLRNNCYHGYTNFTDDPDTYAEFIAFSRVDASGDLDDTDPLLTGPGTGDFSLPTTSPCYRTGHGSGVVTGINDVAFDANEPDIGAWSSGAWAPADAARPTISVADDETGTSFTVTFATAGTSDTMTAWYRRLPAGNLTEFGTTRTGPGTLQVTPVTTGRYEVIGQGETPHSLLSQPSDPVFVTVTTGATIGVEAAVRQLLLDDATVTGLVKGRIYPQDAPPDVAQPYIVYTRVTGNHFHHMKAASGQVASRIQFDYYGNDYDAVKELAEAARQALDGYDDTVSNSEGSLNVELELDSDSDGYTPPTGARGDGLHRVIHDYIIGHAETVPTFT